VILIRNKSASFIPEERRPKETKLKKHHKTLLFLQNGFHKVLPAMCGLRYRGPFHFLLILQGVSSSGSFPVFSLGSTMGVGLVGWKK